MSGTDPGSSGQNSPDREGTTATMSWIKAQASGTGGCVEVQLTTFAVFVRDSKDPDGPVLSYTRQEWAAFLDGARRGEFELP